MCETGNYTTYSTIIPGTSQQDTNDSLTNTKRLLEHTSKESYSHDGMSPNFVDTLIKGENPFDDQITKFCEGQAFPSLRIEQQTGTKGKDTTIKFDTSKGNNRLLVKPTLHHDRTRNPLNSFILPFLTVGATSGATNKNRKQPI